MNKKAKFELIFFLIIFLTVFVGALQGVSNSYTVDSKLDFGATNNVNSENFSDRFISGFEPIGTYFSDSYSGRFGILEEVLEASNISIITNMAINSTDGSNKTLQDLHCSGTLIDPNSKNMNVSIKWFNNSVEIFSYEYNNYSSGTYFSADLGYTNTSKGQNWSCAMRLFNGENYSNWYYSKNLTILNSPPVVNPTYPPSGFLTTNRTPVFNWTGQDDDNDSLTYDFNISLIASSLCVDSGQFVEDILNEYYISSKLNCFYDNGDYYVWSTRANDGEIKGEWSEQFVINISALVDISLPVSSVVFGDVPYLGANNTTDNSPHPFIIQNNGNSLIDVNISATDLWIKALNPTEYYKIKIDNVSGEEGAFNWSGSTTDWSNVSEINNTIFINKLNYLDAIDSAETDVFVQVPENEPPSSKSSTITFASSFAE